MNYRMGVTALLLALFAVPSLDAVAEETAAPPKKKVKLEYLYMSVTGAKTDQVAAAAQKRVKAIKGVKSFVWTIARKEAKIVRVVGQAGTPALVSAFKGAGLTATTLNIGQQTMAFQKKLHCNGCVITVKRALKGVKGTKEVAVAKDKLSVTVVYDMKLTSVAKLKKALAAAGKPVK